MKEKNTQYQVFCQSCGSTFEPAIRSPLWWKAHKKANRGCLDAYVCSGTECGCVKKIEEPKTPYSVIGYTDDCRDFTFCCKTFVDLVKCVQRIRRSCTYFIQGDISEKTKFALQFGI